MRRGCIDIGSNTTRLLVADCSDGDLVECRQERVFTRIGSALTAQSEIPDAKLLEVAEVVAQQSRLARELGAESLRCVATAAVRRARNGAALAVLIERRCPGLRMETLTSEQEAQLAFTGAAWAARPAPDARLAVVDAGGGSTEIVVGVAGPGFTAQPIWWESVPIGSSDVAKRWLHSDPPTRDELAGAVAGVQEQFAAVKPPGEVIRAVAVGGSATSLRAIAGNLLEPEKLAGLIAQAAALTAGELSERFAVAPERASLLTGGLLILRAASNVLGAALEVGGGGLREGVLLSAQRECQMNVREC